MKISDHRNARWLSIVSFSVVLFFLFGGNQFAQTTTQVPKPASHINDFAGVMDERTRLQLENILENVKQKTGVEFGIATVASTGSQDIFDFSQQLALDWGIGARNSRKKSLLLVVSVKEKTSFTQFSKSVQSELPEGVLGEMSQRMRAPLASGQFSEGLEAGVRLFVDSIAQKLGLSANDFYETASVSAADVPPQRSASNPIAESAAPITRPRISGTARVIAPATREDNAPPKTTRPVMSADDEAESEEVELTLTLPLDARVSKLKAFLDTHPDSKSRARATELLVSARAGLGDEKLKKGDTTGGTEQLTQAIVDAPVNASERLFSGVLSQIPLNLYLRGERIAARKAAQSLEAKFGSDARRLLAISGFYLATEQGGEATRLATQAVGLAPDMAEAHQVLARALHISLRLEEAVGEYKRALELEPTSKSARRGLADLSRASGKTEEALALYRQQLVAEPGDKASRTGLVLSLLELGQTEEAKTELKKALQTDPGNLTLLAGTAYWFAAHNDNELAVALGSKAVEMEPRYTWAQIALARGLMAQKKPLEAERALRFARQYGKFPTLDYELATALANAGLYDEAAEILMQSFRVKNNQIETRLAGREAAQGSTFGELLAPERRASIFQTAAADTANNAKILKALLTFAIYINQESGAEINEAGAAAAAREFASGDDAALVFRQLYAASRMLQRGIGFQTVYELAEAARNTADAGMTVPAVTVAVQADEFRDIRARAISSGGTPDIPEAPRNVLSNLLRGRIEDLSGWALFNQDKFDDAVDHLKRATSILPEGTPALRISMWHLGAALEGQGKKEEALAYYIKSYNSGEPDAVRRTLIEGLYRKINGSVTGLEERIGPAPTPSVKVRTSPRDTNSSAHPTSSAESLPTGPPTAAATSSPQVAETPMAPPAGSPEPPPLTAPQPSSTSPGSLPVSSPEVPTKPTSTPTPEASPSTSPVSTPVETTSTIQKPSTTVRITGRVRDSNNNPLANVVVVLIGPQGTVLAATTDEQGNYSFTVAPSVQNYRIIPSQDGFTFEPVDRVLPLVSDDRNELDFVGANRKP